MLILEERILWIDNIKNILSEKLKDNIISATVYGSTLCDDFCEVSDFDILIVFANSNIENLIILKEIKEDFSIYNISIDFNVHTINDMPDIRWDLYRHNNRSFYFQKEIQLYWKQIIWKNLYRCNFSLELLQNEAIKVINSLLYQARKLLINRELNDNEKIRMMKFAIYATLYALWSKWIYIKSKQKALNEFNKHFSTSINPSIFLEEKVHNHQNIQYDKVQDAYNFLVELDNIIFHLYYK